jgi:hypothetical protein
MQQHDERMQEKSAASALAVALLIALLVGSLLLVLSLGRRSSQGTPGNTLHPSKLAGGSGTLISLHMINLTTGWALGEHAVLRTSDGGLQWKNVAPPNAVLTRESIADFLTDYRWWSDLAAVDDPGDLLKANHLHRLPAWLDTLRLGSHRRSGRGSRGVSNQ